MEGWASLGNVLAGGIDRQGAHAEGMALGAKTQNALAQARVRRVEESVKRDEYEQKQTLAENLFKSGLVDDYRTAEGMAGINRAGAGNIQQIMAAQQTGQTTGFRNEMADPGTPFDRVQRLRAAAGDSAFDPTKVQGGLAFDLLAPDPFASRITTPGEEASIRQRDAAASLSAAREAWGPQGRAGETGPEDLGELLSGIHNLPTGIDPTINFSEGTGVPAWAARIGNIVAGIVPGMDMPAPDRERAINALEDLQARSIMSAKALVNQRMSNQLMDLMTNLTVTPADILRGDQRALTRYAQTRDFMQAKAREIEFMLAQPGGTNSQRHGLRNDLIVLTNLANAYGQVVSQFEAPQARGVVQRPGAAPEAPALPEGWTVRRVE